MILATRHTGIVVQDLEKSLHFWRDVMGLQVVADFWERGEFIDTLQQLSGVNLHMIKLAAPDGTLVELLKDEAHPTPPPDRNSLCDRGIRHIAFTVADVEASWRTLRARGCEELSVPITSPDGRACLFFARDPEGNLLEIVQVLPLPEEHRRAPEASTSEPARIATRYRRIVSDIPHPASQAVIEALSRLEPRSMAGFSPVVWHRAEGCQVWDAHGNQWLDFTSTILVANAGHANPRIGQALRAQLDSCLYHAYCNPHAMRLRTLQAIRDVLPAYLDKIFLVSTGSEAVEAAIKLMRIHGRTIAPGKLYILSYYNSFHGRTMAAQAAGGFLDQQAWMGEPPAGFQHIPFPECPRPRKARGLRCPWGKAEYAGCGAECLQRSLDQLRAQGLRDDDFAGVISETFQGPTVAFMPPDYARTLREWATAHQVLLAFDEVQAGFGRTGRWFGFEHYGVEADLICLGKGMTSSLPTSAVAGRAAIMDLPEHGEMSSTHTGNPLCCAATIANIAAIRDEGWLANAAALEPVTRQALERLRDRFPDHLGAINGHGLAWGMYVLDPLTGDLNPSLAQRVIQRCMELGLLLLPTGGRGTLKIAPPLCISEEALREGIGVIEEALEECGAI
jgi:4-aminobutyrate aminotransferase/(S)-3-amino-2-methylpropionate transaminase